MRNIDTKEPTLTLPYNDELLIACRNHIESLQNLAYMARINARQTIPLKLNMDLIEFHLRRLSDLLFLPQTPNRCQLQSP